MDKKAASAMGKSMPPGLHSLLRNILKEYKANGTERLDNLLQRDALPRSGQHRRIPRSRAAAVVGAGSVFAYETHSASSAEDELRSPPPFRVHTPSRKNAALPSMPRCWSASCLPTQVICPNPSSSALPPLALPFAPGCLPFTHSRYAEEFVEDGTLGTGGFGTVFKVLDEHLSGQLLLWLSTVPLYRLTEYWTVAYTPSKKFIFGFHSGKLSNV